MRALQAEELRQLMAPVLHRVGEGTLAATLPPRLDVLLTLRMPPAVSALYQSLVNRV